MPVIELSITCRDSERKLTKDFLIHEPFTLDLSDPVLDTYTREVREEFKGEPDDIKIKAIMVIK